LKTLFDEGVPDDLIEYLPGHDVSTSKMMGWKGIKNGKLLALVETANFEAFITNDKRMGTQQHLRNRPFTTLVLSALNWPVIKPHVGKIAEALDKCMPGTVTKVECGRFVPTKYRKPPL
jgi:hypothetical protein